jgi:hypothetical protein
MIGQMSTTMSSWYVSYQFTVLGEYPRHKRHRITDPQRGSSRCGVVTQRTVDRDGRS